VSARDVLWIVVVVLAALLALGLLAIVGHGLWSLARARMLAPRLSRAGAALAEAAEEGSLAPAGARALRKLPFDVRLQVFVDLAPSLSGAPREAITRAAAEIGLIARAERRCASRSWRRRLRAVRLLTLLGGGEEAVPPLFADSRVELRTQAAEWAAEHPTDANARRLVAQLDDPEMLARFTVQDSLVRIGAVAVAPLAETIGTAEPEAAVGALRVAASLADPRLRDAALERRDDADPRVRACAAAVLGRVGGEESVAALVAYLGDADGDVRAAAAGALGRLGHWPAAAALAAALRDPEWEVRRQSALALRAFGAVGEVLLRRAGRDEDRFARDIATHALDLPEVVVPG